jgi:hypothetical protein
MDPYTDHGWRDPRYFHMSKVTRPEDDWDAKPLPASGAVTDEDILREFDEMLDATTFDPLPADGRYHWIWVAGRYWTAEEFLGRYRDDVRWSRETALLACGDEEC